MELTISQHHAESSRTAEINFDELMVVHPWPVDWLSKTVMTWPSQASRCAKWQLSPGSAGQEVFYDQTNFQSAVPVRLNKPRKQ